MDINLPGISRTEVTRTIRELRVSGHQAPPTVGASRLRFLHFAG